MLFKLLSFFIGYVTITVPEQCFEKFVNMASTRGIFVWGISIAGGNRVALKVRLYGIKPLRHVARMAHCRFQITKREGLPFFISKLRRRKALLGGALAFVLTLYLLSSFIWIIDVTGNQFSDRKKIMQIARESGLYRGVPKWFVKTSKVEENVMRQVPGLSWVGVYIDGTKVSIKVVEKVLPPSDNLEQPADVVAIKDGLIKEILVLSGHPVVNEGDIVKAGQVLISAVIPPPENEEQKNTDEQLDEQSNELEDEERIRYVHAQGIVRARIWYEGYEEMKLVEKSILPTGQEITKLCIKFGGKEIILMGPRQAPYVHYDKQTVSKRLPQWRNISVPVEFITIKYREVKPNIKKYSIVQARRLTGIKVLESIREQIPPGAKILNEQLREVETNELEDIIRVRALVETLEDVGKQVPYQVDRGGSDIVDGKNRS